MDNVYEASARVCRSTFAGETMACAEAVETAILVRGLVLSFMHGRLFNNEEAAQFMEMHFFTDCKSLYDHIQKEGAPKPPSEKRLALDLAGIRQALREETREQWRRAYGSGDGRPDRPLKAPLHWLPTGRQLADVLTKKMAPGLWWAQIHKGFLSLPLRAMPNVQEARRE